MATGKDRHYWTQLLATLTAGNWDVALPGKAPNGTLLPWSELLRKFNKHCHGYADVAELASQTQALALVLESGAGEHNVESKESGFQNRFSDALDLDDECVLPEERREEAGAGYTALKGLRCAGKEPVRLALAYYAYALGRPEECLALLSEVTNLPDIPARVAAYESMRADASAPSASLVSVLEPSASTSRTGSLVSVSTIPRSEAEEGRLWGLTECIRSITLEGMSRERLSPQDPQQAIDTYMRAVPLINAVLPEIQRTVNPASAQVTSMASLSFARFQELWRWTERALRRAIILAAQLSDPTAEDGLAGSFWTLQGLYRGCSAHWPPAFHPELRSTVATIHLRAFVLRARLLPSDALRAKAPRWISSARSVLQELRALLSVCTRFPRAGERNVRVEDFVDLCVAVWEADGAVGEYAGWAIDFLWWATRLTFNSFRIYRHMARLLAASGDPALARRTLKLYVQVVSKAREAGGADADADSDRQWVQTLVQGAGMLCRLAVAEGDHGRALELAKEAGTLVQQAKARLDGDDKEMVAGVQLAEGIWFSVMAYTEQDPRTRNAKLAHSLEAFTAAVGTYPSASAHHHLALALARPGPAKDVPGAIAHARAAVELGPGEVRHWHLLGLLLGATGDWQAAQSVLELGIGIAEADLADDEPPPEQNGSARGLTIRDFVQTVQDADAAPATGDGDGVNGVNGVNGDVDAPPSRETILPPGAKDVPPSAALLQPGGGTAASRQEKFEYALQARMTQLALTEFVAGAEAVGDKWLEVFQWFREKRPATLDDRRQSIDSRRVSAEVRSNDAASMRTAQPMMTSPRGPSLVLPPDDSSGELAPPVGITITPATPAAASEDAVQSILDGAEKRSGSLDEKDRDVSRGKKVREVLKSGVHKGQARITTISKKIGHGVGRHGSLSLKRTTSAPDFHSVLAHNPYQASSIHLRQYHSIHASQQDLAMLDVPPPPRTSSPDPVSRTNSRTSRDLRLLSDLWLMSAAIFRRLGKIEQARGAIQEAEVRDEDNPAVWVQLGLYQSALGDEYRAAEAFRKALFIHPNDVAATVYLCRIYLSPAGEAGADMENVDLAAGLLSELTRGAGWDVPEAWYFLARAYKLQGRRDRERECLNFALTLSQTRGVRDPTVAVGWCL
ncbi:tetratricopeptide repeat protein [Phanerochaete sordida]|uniref:Tetratricopeptide repeat protein n=1 Tax=Phanerochaete sordida TaxID=48140 RepID=A0A9P3GM05_9APHY|nr:tetratricopeptide repeat protein [Phanerochaete sordida]